MLKANWYQGFVILGVAGQEASILCGSCDDTSRSFTKTLESQSNGPIWIGLAGRGRSSCVSQQKGHERHAGQPRPQGAVLAIDEEQAATSEDMGKPEGKAHPYRPPHYRFAWPVNTDQLPG